MTALISLASCGIPRDPSGTADRVERSGVLRLGMVEGAALNEAARDTLGRVSQETGARLHVTRGDSEELLSELESGKLDLVYGDFAANSPWKKNVYLGNAQGRLGKPGKSEQVPRFATMLGENGWIMQLGKASQ